ncbi:hypothetical protein [Mesomycoplasma ovipneumoniae]|uniref:hypothetical protein n=1 Tax=Mesomycoplasma ovipneumoniae TaxID=29562 RepID=UPI0028A93911|nr:hypothetical protein [Mesomycoplasma ovipneumoniae]WNM16257.1 hypothetical protein RNM19_02710 [Mesomycoplasma ovipneumoniae]
MSIINYTTKSKNTTKKNKKIFYSNSSYLFFVFWVIRDFEFKKKGQKCKFLDVRQIWQKLNANWESKTWNMKTIYKILTFLVKENIIETQKIGSRLIVINVLDLKKYYIPKKVLDLSINSQKLLSSNYLKVYQYLKNLAIGNFKLNNWKNSNYWVENSYTYFQNLGLSNETISKALKWFSENNIQIQFENKTMSKKLIHSVNLDKNTYYKAVKYEKQLISISLKSIQKNLYRQFQNNKVYFWSKNIFEWKVTKTIVVKFKKIYEYVIKRPCYLLRKSKNGLSYLPCWCKNKGAHWKINSEKPKWKWKPFYQDKRLIVRLQGRYYWYKIMQSYNSKLLVLRS